MKTLNYTLFIIWLALTYSVALLIEPELLRSLTVEDGPVENLGALAFFFASLTFFFLFFKDVDGNQILGFKTKRNIFHLLLGLLCFLAAGEEISWGQRILSIETPEAIAELNMQKEINLHNLAIFHGRDAEGERKSGIALLLNMDRLFSLFWLSYCVILPITVSLSEKIRSYIDKWNLPSFGVPIGSLFLINYIFSKIAEGFSDPVFHHNITEIKETHFGILFLLAGSVLVIVRARQAVKRANASRVPAALTETS